MYLALLAAILFCGSLMTQAQNDGVTLYFSTDEMPDLIKCLPPPPDTIGEDFAHDIIRYMWGKSQRADSARAAIVFRDAVWSFDALLAEFNVPLGLTVTKEGTPEIYKYMVNSLATIDQMRVAPKAYYHRKRPFERFHEHMLTRYEEKELSGEGSYPSGHSQRGYAAALLFIIYDAFAFSYGKFFSYLAEGEFFSILHVFFFVVLIIMILIRAGKLRKIAAQK